MIEEKIKAMQRANVRASTTMIEERLKQCNALMLINILVLVLQNLIGQQ